MSDERYSFSGILTTDSHSNFTDNYVHVEHFKFFAASSASTLAATASTKPDFPSLCLVSIGCPNLATMILFTLSA